MSQELPEVYEGGEERNSTERNPNEPTCEVDHLRAQNFDTSQMDSQEDLEPD